MVDARAVAMHPLSYLLKRNHLSALRIGRAMFAPVADMTPARFDILHVLFDSATYKDTGRRYKTRPRIWLEQTRIRRTLGLARQTVWKMVERLVELGLLEKGYRGRFVVVRLSEEGATRIRAAYATAFTERYPLPKDAEPPVPRHVYRVVRDEAHEKERAAARFAAERAAENPRGVAAIYAAWGFFRPEPPAPPKKFGREVERSFTAFAWNRVRPGRNRRYRQLEKLDSMIGEARSLGAALGDTSALIYRLHWESDH